MLSKRLRQLRNEQGLTLADVAKQSGLSTAMVSHVERGQVDPSLESLRRLAQTLGVPLFELFREEDDAPITVVRHNERRSISNSENGITYSLASRTGGSLELLEATLPAGEPSTPELRSHKSEECVLVQRGSLTVEFRTQTVVLEQGDSCHFDSTLPHRFVNQTEDPVLYLVAVTPPSI